MLKRLLGEEYKPSAMKSGKLWTSLADFYIRRGMFDKACDIYEEAIASVITVRDFSLIFDAYTKFEESMLSAKLQDETSECTENV